MYAFLADKPRLYEGDISLKTSFLIPKKKHVVLYDDLFAIFPSNDLQKPTTLLPNECLVSVAIAEAKPTQLDLMFFGKSESYSLSFSVATAAIAKTWEKHLGSVIEPPAIRTKKQIDYKDVLDGKFWEDVVNIALANRDRSDVCPVPVRHILLQGILKKRSPKAVLGHRPWQSRIFILRQDSLIYYKTKDEPPCGAFMLRDIVRVSSAQTEPRMDISIRIDDGAVRVMSLQAQSYEEIAIWVDRIQKAKEAYEDAVLASQIPVASPLSQTTDECESPDSSKYNSVSQLNICRQQAQAVGPNFYSRDRGASQGSNNGDAIGSSSAKLQPTSLSTHQEDDGSVVGSFSNLGTRKAFSPSQGPRNMRNALLDSDSDDDIPAAPARSAPINKTAYKPLASSNTTNKSSNFGSSPKITKSFDDDNDDDEDIPLPPPRETHPSFSQKHALVVNTPSPQRPAPLPLEEKDETVPSEASSVYPSPSNSTSDSVSRPMTSPSHASTSLISNMRSFRSVLDAAEDESSEGHSSLRANEGIGQIYASERKRRMQRDKYNLDMTYITNNIIVMGKPVENPEGGGNSLKEVKEYLDKYHYQSYMICNLSKDSSYDQSYFDYAVRKYPMEPDAPPPFRLIDDFCIDIGGFLYSNENNVVVIHCDGLNGLASSMIGSSWRRNLNEGCTMLLVACLLIFIRHPGAQSAQEAIETYVAKRLQLNMAENLCRVKTALALMSPSQIRWVRLFERHMREYFWRGVPFPATDQEIRFKSMRLFPSAEFDKTGGCDPYVVIRPIQSLQKELYNSLKDDKKVATHKHWNGDKPFSIQFSAPIPLVGEIEIAVWDRDLIGKDELMFKVWLQTSFTSSSMVLLQKHELDLAAIDYKCTHFPEDFSCMFEFEGTGLDQRNDVAINDLFDDNEVGARAASGSLVFPPAELSTLELKDAAVNAARGVIVGCNNLARILPSHCKPKNKNKNKDGEAVEDNETHARTSLRETYGSANVLQLQRLGVNIQDMEQDSEEELGLYSDSDDDDEEEEGSSSKRGRGRQDASGKSSASASRASSPSYSDNKHHNNSVVRYNGDSDLSTADDSGFSRRPAASPTHEDDEEADVFPTSRGNGRNPVPHSPLASPTNTSSDKKNATAWSIKNVARKLVSKKKKRFQQDGFNLDLTYIAPTIIAMGYPSEGLEASFRNPMGEVQRFLQQYHDGHYKVYNLCSERGYNPDRFQRVARFPFDDHNPCSMQMLFQFCQDAGTFLQADPENVVAIHCKAGKGRTGLMIGALLIYMQAFDTSLDSLRFYGHQRTSNLKGVTIPSQQRFVTYFEMFVRYYLNQGLANAFPFQGVPILIKKIILRPYANFDRGGGCDPFFVVHDLAGNTVYNHKKACFGSKQKLQNWKSDGTQPEIHLEPFERLEISKETKFVFYDYDRYSRSEKMFHFWIHPVFMYGLLVGSSAPPVASITLTKPELDKAVKDRKCSKFPADFSCEIIFSRPENDLAGNY